MPLRKYKPTTAGTRWRIGNAYAEITTNIPEKSLFVVPEYNDNFYLSLRNVPGVNGTVISDMNTYDILNANVLVLSESAAKLFSAEVEEETEA